MNKRKFTMFSIAGIILITAIVIALYINSIGVNNLKLMYTLNNTDKSIIKMEGSSDGDGHYLTKINPPTALIKERMQNEGWTYVEQEGAGHFFEKDNQRVVVVTKIWNRRFVEITVEDNIVNIADSN